MPQVSCCSVAHRHAPGLLLASLSIPGRAEQLYEEIEVALGVDDTGADMLCTAVSMALAIDGAATPRSERERQTGIGRAEQSACEEQKEGGAGRKARACAATAAEAARARGLARTVRLGEAHEAL